MDATNTRAAVAQRIRAGRVIAILRLAQAEQLISVAHALVRAGACTLEVTLTTPGALEGLAELRRTLLGSGITLGAGTVLDASAAEAALAAGADFLVSPALLPEVVAAAHGADRVAMPGCFSPTEVFRAWQLGADFIKVFPASVLTPRFLRELQGPFPNLPLVPSGGVRAEQVGEWFAAGATAVGLGSGLFEPEALQSQNWDAITVQARRVLEHCFASAPSL
jgi:2-dehydro-3-deoxyphosphogluconate aldolase/(4S)-4-hydroxy-2-oxoglutarate aldolase